MDILTQEQWLLNAQAKFDALKKNIWKDSQAGIRIDQEERDAFAELQAIGLMLLRGFATGAGVGDEGAQVTRSERTLRRNDKMHEKVYRSVFGTFSIWRWVYATGPKKKIEYVPTDAWLRKPDIKALKTQRHRGHGERQGTYYAMARSRKGQGQRLFDIRHWSFGIGRFVVCRAARNSSCLQSASPYRRMQYRAFTPSRQPIFFPSS